MSMAETQLQPLSCTASAPQSFKVKMLCIRTLAAAAQHAGLTMLEPLDAEFGLL